MKRRRSSIRFFIATTTLFLFAIAPSTASADTEGSPPPFTATTPDGKHVFRMLAAYEIGKPYPASGMYLNDGSTVPLWTVDWNASAYVPAGGQYVIRRGPWARWSGTYREEALTFFSNGHPTKTYTTADLIDFPWLLPHTVSHYGWEFPWTPSESDDHPALIHSFTRYSNAGVTFDDENQRIRILTVLGDQLTFDLGTGEIVEATRSRAITTLFIFAILLIAYMAWRIRYPSTVSGRPIIGPSNVLVGGLFTFSLVVIPTTVAHYFRVADTFAEESYVGFIRMGFETLPRYVAAFFGFEAPEFRTSGSAIVVCFWPASLAVFTILDRTVVAIVEGVRKIK